MKMHQVVQRHYLVLSKVAHLPYAFRTWTVLKEVIKNVLHMLKVIILSRTISMLYEGEFASGNHLHKVKLNLILMVLCSVPLNASGIGVILRDDRGEVLFAMSRKEVHVLEAQDVETMAALRDLQMILNLGISSLVLEGDSLVVIEAIRSREDNLSRHGPLIAEIQVLLNQFRDFEVLNVGRQGNEAAHLLARHDRLVEDIVQWWYQCLDIIHSRVMIDAAM